MKRLRHKVHRIIEQAHIASFVLLFGLMGALFLHLSSAAKAETQLYVAPPSASQAQGGTLEVQIKLANPTQASIGYAKAYLNFSIANLAVRSISATSSNFTVNDEQTYNNTAGTIHIIREKAVLPKATDQLIATVTFETKAQGSATISYTNDSFVSLTKGNANTLSKATGGNYSITSPFTGGAPDPTGDTTPPVDSDNQIDDFDDTPLPDDFGDGEDSFDMTDSGDVTDSSDITNGGDGSSSAEGGTIDQLNDDLGGQPTGSQQNNKHTNMAVVATFSVLGGIALAVSGFYGWKFARSKGARQLLSVMSSWITDKITRRRLPRSPGMGAKAVTTHDGVRVAPVEVVTPSNKAVNIPQLTEDQLKTRIAEPTMVVPSAQQKSHVNLPDADKIPDMFEEGKKRLDNEDPALKK